MHTKLTDDFKNSLDNLLYNFDQVEILEESDEEFSPAQTIRIVTMLKMGFKTIYVTPEELFDVLHEIQVMGKYNKQEGEVNAY